MALNHAIETASHQNLEPRCTPHPKGVRWWNNECFIAQTATCCAKGAARQAAFKTLRCTMRMAQRMWAHDLLHEAADSTDIWHMATTCKGHQANTFPALRMANNTLVKDPNMKAEALKA